MRIDDALASVQSLGLDTSPVIYFIEVNPRYIAQVDEVFRRISRQSMTGVTSMVTLAEVLVQPFLRSNAWLANKYRDLLLNSGTLQLIPVGSAVAERAAALRARYRLRMPDALQIATAIEQRCDAFLTNDRGLQRVGEIRVLVLDDLEA